MSQRQIVQALNYKDTPLRASQISQYENGAARADNDVSASVARLAGISTDVLIADDMKLSLKK